MTAQGPWRIQAGRGTRVAEEPGMRRLLLVDDERNVLLGMRRYFGASGFQVDCASEREEAEALLCAAGPYQGVVVDLSLTAGRGPDGLRLIGRARECCPRAGIIVLTAFGSPEIQAEALRLGADLFLQKPRPLAEIGAALDALLAPS